MLNFIFFLALALALVACQTSPSRLAKIDIDYENWEIKASALLRMYVCISTRKIAHPENNFVDDERILRTDIDNAVALLLTNKYRPYRIYLDSNNLKMLSDLGKQISTTGEGNAIGNYDVLKTMISPDKTNMFGTIYFLYSQRRGEVYVWFPVDWANYLIRADSASLRKDYELQPTLLAREKKRYLSTLYLHLEMYNGDYERAKKSKELYDKRSKENAQIRENDRFQIWKMESSEKSFQAYSVKHTQAFKLLDTIVSHIQQPDTAHLDTLLSYLHNPSFYITTSGFSQGGRLYIEGLERDSVGQPYIEILEDTLRALPNETNLSDVFERVEAEDIRRMELYYPDYTSENMAAVANYAEQRRPARIYFKRALSPVRGDIAYYFLFYYADYAFFEGWRLRDLEVVFPRRFLTD